MSNTSKPAREWGDHFPEPIREYMTNTTSVAKIPPSGIAFHPKVRGLSHGQQTLIDMLKTHVNEGKQVTREDIINCYMAAAEKPRTKYSYQCVNGVWQYVSVTRTSTDWDTYRKAMDWFKKNLGACIVRGKLIVIPIIEE